MSRQQLMDSVSERRLRPIYDWLDNGNNKKALQEADKVLRKQPELQCCRVLKSLALLRLGREEEAEAILDKVLSEAPTDEGSLQAMTIGYRELRQPEKISLMYEQASKKEPSNEEFLTHLFMSYVRLEEYKKQQITAINLYKIKLKKPYYFWSVMSLVMQALDGDPKIAQTVTLPLAFKMLEKMEKEGRLEQEQEAMLYLMVLELREDWLAARQLLSGPLGKILESSATCHLRCISKRLEVEERLENWVEVVRISRNLIISQPDQWSNYNSYFTALLHLRDKEESNEALEEVNDLIADVVDRSVSQARQLLRVLQTRNPRLRGPWLAEIDLASRAEERVDSALLLAYLDRFSSKPVCFSDMKKYISFIGDNDKEGFIKSLQERCCGKPLTTQGEICSDACAEALLRCAGHHDRLSREEKEALVRRLVAKHELCQPVVANMETTELRPSDVYLILAGHILWDLWHKHDELRYLSLAVAMLQYGLKSSPSNWQLKLLLIRLCGAVGGSSVCEEVHTTLDIKHLMLDSLGWVLPRLLASTSQMSKADRLYCQIVRLYVYCPKETIEHIIQAYKLGNFNQIADIYELKKRILRSLNYSLTETERLLLDLVDKTTSHASAVELVSLFEYSPSTPPPDWEQLRDNRDFATMVSYDQAHRLITHQHIQDSFQSELDFARLRNVLLRCLAASLYLSDDISDLAKNSRSVMNGESSETALSQLVAELESLYKGATASHSSDRLPQHLPQAPYRPRLESYVPSHELSTLLPLLQAVVHLHRAAASHQKSEETSALPILEEVISRIAETQRYWESEPRFTSVGPSWARLYRWELFTYSIETVALATILSGAIQAILRPANKQQQQAKTKKKVVLAPFLSAVPTYNQLLQQLETLAEFLLRSLEKFGEELEEERLRESLSSLGLTSSWVEEQQADMASRLSASFKDQLEQMRKVVLNKKKYLQSLQL